MFNRYSAEYKNENYDDFDTDKTEVEKNEIRRINKIETYLVKFAKNMIEYRVPLVTSFTM